MAARWGSLLSQAVAGVEARLDTILADNDDDTPQQKETKPPAAPSSPAKQSPGMSASLAVWSVPEGKFALTARIDCRCFENLLE